MYDSERVLDILRRSKERMEQSRNIIRESTESVISSKRAIQQSLHVLQSNAAIVERLTYFSNARQKFRDGFPFFFT